MSHSERVFHTLSLRRLLYNVGVCGSLCHPNNTEHHIAWIRVFFLPEGSKYPYKIGEGQFSAHGASTEGSDTSLVYTHHQLTFSFKSGTIYAFSYCNIHGLWVNSE